MALRGRRALRAPPRGGHGGGSLPTPPHGAPARCSVTAGATTGARPLGARLARPLRGSGRALLPPADSCGCSSRARSFIQESNGFTRAVVFQVCHPQRAHVSVQLRKRAADPTTVSEPLPVRPRGDATRGAAASRRRSLQCSLELAVDGSTACTGCGGHASACQVELGTGANRSSNSREHCQDDSLGAAGPPRADGPSVALAGSPHTPCG